MSWLGFFLSLMMQLYNDVSENEMNRFVFFILPGAYFYTSTGSYNEASRLLFLQSAIQSGGRRLECVATFYRFPNAREHLRKRRRRRGRVRGVCKFRLAFRSSAHLANSVPALMITFLISPRTSTLRASRKEEVSVRCKNIFD